MTIIFGLLGIVFGVAVGLFVSIYLIKKSNDFGDSYGNTKDYEGEFLLLDKEDHISKRRFEQGISKKDMHGYLDKLKDLFD